MGKKYLTKQQWANTKRNLTRLVNKKDDEGTIAFVRETFAYWDANGYAWPDDWARLQRAKDDATLRLRIKE